jgi:hypothetical protein
MNVVDLSLRGREPGQAPAGFVRQGEGYLAAVRGVRRFGDEAGADELSNLHGDEGTAELQVLGDGFDSDRLRGAQHRDADQDRILNPCDADQLRIAVADRFQAAREGEGVVNERAELPVRSANEQFRARDRQFMGRIRGYAILRAPRRFDFSRLSMRHERAPLGPLQRTAGGSFAAYKS